MTGPAGFKPILSATLQLDFATYQVHIDDSKKKYVNHQTLQLEQTLLLEFLCAGNSSFFWIVQSQIKVRQDTKILDSKYFY